MGVLQRSRHRKAVHRRDAAIADLRDASGRLGRAVARLARATQNWSSSQAGAALDAAAESEAMTRAREAGGSAAQSVSEAARNAQSSVVSTARVVRKRGLRAFDVSVLIGVLLLRKRLQKTRAARRAAAGADSPGTTGTAGTTGTTGTTG